MQKLDSIQQDIDIHGGSDVLLNQEQKVQCELQQAFHFQDHMRKEKSRMNWFSQGDRNTKFFQKMATIRNVSKQITMLKCGYDILTSSADLEKHIVDYFESLFTGDNGCVNNGIIEDVIPKAVSEGDNEMLTSMPSMEEIKEAVFAMNTDSAPGPD